MMPPSNLHAPAATMSGDLTATPRPSPAPLEEEKSLPMPPLEEILMERQQQMRRGRQQGVDGDLSGDHEAGKCSSSLPSTSSASTSMHSESGSPVQGFETPQLWPTASNSSPTLLDQGGSHANIDASVMSMTQATGSITLARRRRNGSHASSGAGSTSSPNLPDPSTFPIPPSPAASIRHEGMASSDVASSTSGHTNSARGSSLWSMNRFSRNSSWDTNHSSPMTTPSSSRDCNMVATAMGGDSGKADIDDDDDVGLGIYSTSETAASSETPAAARGGAAEADRWAHHRNPLWTRKQAPLVTPLSQQLSTDSSSSSAATSDPRTATTATAVDGAERPLEQTPILAPRPTLGRMVSEPNLTDSLVSTTSSVLAPPLLPPMAIPSRGASRNRTRSEASPPSVASTSMKRRPSKASATSSVASTLSSEEGSFALLARAVSPRGSSLRKQNSQRSHKPGSSKSGSTGMKTSNSLSKFTSSASLHRKLESCSSLRDLGGNGMASSSSQGASLASSSSLSSIASGGPDYESRGYHAGGNRSRAMSTHSVASSLSIDVRALGVDFPHLAAINGDGEEESVGDAVKVVEEGRGVVIEGKGRDLADVEYQVGSETSHLLLSGCNQQSGEEMTAFLERTIPLAASSLLVLDVSNTGIVDLPPCLEQCSRLEELNVSGNALAAGRLPSWIGSLSTLRVLIADDVGLTSLPHSMSALAELTTLSIRNNRLSHLPSWLCQLSGKLERLYIDGNPFKGGWQKLLASIFPSQIPPLAAPVSAPAMVSDSSAPASPAYERRPGFARMKSDDGLSKFFTPKSSQSTAPSTPPEQEQKLRMTTIEEQMQRRGPSSSGFLDRDATVKAPKSSEGGESKWAFLRKVTRKTSSNLLNASFSATPSESSSRDGGTEAGSNAPSANGSPVRSRLPSMDAGQHRSPKSLPRLHTSTNSLSRHFEQGPPVPPSAASTASSHPQPHSGLLAAFEPTPRSVSSPEERRNLGVKPESKRRSFLDFKRVETPQDDPLELKGRMHALMCYLRDLDDLAPASQARRRRAASSARNSDGSSMGVPSMSSHGDVAINESPIRLRHPSGPLAPSSLAALTSSSTAAEVKDDSRRRRRIIAEIISSEESYIRGLQELCDIYVKPAKMPDEKGNNGSSIMTPHDHRAVFGNVEGLLQFHVGAFLPSLKAAADAVLRRGNGQDEDDDESDGELTASAAESVARVFLEHSGWFRMYSAYINGCDQAQSKLTSWLAPSQPSSAAAAFRSAASNAAGGSGGDVARARRIKAFLKRCRLDPRHSQLSVESYLLLPVQRIPRYELLLKDLARSTDPKRLRDPEAVSSALAQMSAIAASVNESKRQSEQDRKLLLWQGRLRTGWHTPLVQPHRRLLRDGTVQLRRIVQRVKAFDDANGANGNGAGEEACDGAYGENGSQVDCLEQHTVGKPITLLLCNDVCVAVTVEGSNGSSSGTSTPSSSASPSSALAASSSNGAVDLFALLKPRHGSSGATSTASLCCEVMGQNFLRLVDGKRILYMSTRTHAEAVEWCDAINAVATSNGSAGLRRAA